MCEWVGGLAIPFVPDLLSKSYSSHPGLLFKWILMLNESKVVIENKKSSGILVVGACQMLPR